MTVDDATAARRVGSSSGTATTPARDPGGVPSEIERLRETVVQVGALLVLVEVLSTVATGGGDPPLWIGTLLIVSGIGSALFLFASLVRGVVRRHAVD